MLASLLAGRTEAGVYLLVDAHSAEAVRHTVEHAGWAFGLVDGWTTPGKAGFLDAVGDALAFPSWYGRNLDALADCLRDVGERTLLLWDGWGPLAREDRDAFDGVVDVLRERAATEPSFAALLRGEGPDVPVAAL